MDPEIHTTLSEDETIELGRRFATRLHLGDIVTLYGDLGAGKTEFVKGVCDYFNVSDIVSSPTYTIMNQYDGEDRDHDALKIYHVDLFRIKTPAELEEIGFEDCMYSHDSIKLVEWAERANGHLPASRFNIVFHQNDDNENMREIRIEHVDRNLAERGSSPAEQG